MADFDKIWIDEAGDVKELITPKVESYGIDDNGEISIMTSKPGANIFPDDNGNRRFVPLTSVNRFNIITANAPDIRRDAPTFKKAVPGSVVEVELRPTSAYAFRLKPCTLAVHRALNFYSTILQLAAQEKIIAEISASSDSFKNSYTGDFE